MPIKVENIAKKSLASEYSIKPGAVIYKINETHIEDVLDFYYLIDSSNILIEIQNPLEEKKTIKIVNHFDKPIGIQIEAPQCKECINNCIFCFVDQMPENMRHSLYVKDDDFVFSFMYGNFITLTNLTDYFIDKIIRLHISPLYVSVHTTNPVLHKNMLNYPREFNILNTLKKLADNQISLHTQIVLVPDWNDKIELEKTIRDLSNPDLSVESIGIVPVGLTQYRQHLNPLRLFSPEECKEIIAQIDSLKIECNNSAVFCADEFYVKAQLEIPQPDYYEDFSQVENGIGMVCLTLQNWKKNKRKFIKFISTLDKKILFITSQSGKYVVEIILNDLNRTIPDKCDLIQINNDFFGESVTVSGLLTWTDVKNQIDKNDKYIYAFSSNFFNYEDKTLDDFSTDDICAYFEQDILIINELFENWTKKKCPKAL